VDEILDFGYPQSASTAELKASRRRAEMWGDVGRYGES